LVQRPGRPSALHRTRVVVRATRRSVVRDHDACAARPAHDRGAPDPRTIVGRIAPRPRAIRLFCTRRPSRMPTPTTCSPSPFVSSC